MLNSLSKAKPESFREKVDRKLSQGIIDTKYNLGLGLSDDQKQTLDDVYHNIKTGYSSINELQRRSGLIKEDVEDYLQHKETYTKHKPADTRFPTRKVITRHPHN